ncbi:hypothetical protein BH11MYX4_BH11MYX4_03630 [soil metagenome]
MKLSMLVASVLGLSAAACAGAPAAPARVASASPAETSDVAPATGRSTTLATAISGAAEEPREETKADEPAPVPTTCEAEGTIKDAKLCMPERAYAKKLCSGVYPEVALGLFGKGTPFTRVYLAGDVEAWNASGGRTHRAKLAFDEEVIVLARNGAAAMGGIVMTGAQNSYDVLRWDGTCVSIMDGELTTKRPPAPKPAELAFSRLEESTRHALLEAPKVKATHAALGKACMISAAATSANRKACEKADKAFSQAIVETVRNGAPLPSPARRP